MKDDQLSGKEDDLLEELPRHLRVKLLRFMNQDMRRLWSTIRSELVHAPEQFKEMSESLPEIFALISPNADLRNKREVYVSIAKFLQGHLRQPLPICLNTVHLLCHEADPSLVEDGATGGERFLELAKALILTIKVYYEPQDARIYNRKTEIYYLKDDQPASIRFPEQLDWESVPEDVRENRIRKGMEPEVFKLYPKEA